MLSKEPLISCVMPTYGRPDFVHESVQMFLEQDYLNKELIILNDCAGQIYRLEHPDVRVFNMETPFNTLGEKRNAGIQLASGEVIAVWDDDDIYLSWHLSFSLAEMRRHQTPLYRPAEYWAWWGNDFGFHNNQAIRGWMHHAMCLFTKNVWARVGGYPAMDVREDGEFADRLARIGIEFESFPIAKCNRSFVLRGKSKYNHMSMVGGEQSLDESPREIQVEPCAIRDVELQRHCDQLISDRLAKLAKRIVIGLGTGRCGTKSLSELLGLPHEDGGPLPWEVDEAKLLQRIDRWHESDASVVGDVGFYYLPYVELLRRQADCRFVCLKRDRQATIESYLRKTEGKNHWMLHDGSRWELDPIWDVAFPKYEVESKAKAIGRYWDEYYAKAEELVGEDFGVCPTKSLNDSVDCDAMMSFRLLRQWS